MDNIRVRDCRMIMSAFPADDRQFLEQADIILLAGGSASRGWQVFEQSGMKEVIAERYQGGAILMGTSAGAMQLGVLGWEEEDLRAETFFYTFGLVPFIISAHEEKESWERLKKAVVFLGNYIPGLGIPSGGGMLSWLTQSWGRIDRHQAHLSQESGNAFVVHFIVLTAQPGRHFLDPIKRRARVLLIQQAHQQQVLLTFWDWLIIIAGACQANQLALSYQTDGGMLCFNQRPLLFHPPN